MKQCRCCKKEKENKDFTKKSSNLDGLYSYCKACTAKKNKVSYQENRNLRIESGRKYYGKNRESLKIKWIEYYKRNKKSCLEKRADYREKNKDKISLKAAQTRLLDEERFEKNRKNHLRWSKNNRDHLNKWQREWYQKNKEKRRAHVIVNRAIKSGKLMRPGTCSECNKNCKPDGHHVDYTNPLEVIWICRACHSRKSPRTVIK